MSNALAVITGDIYATRDAFEAVLSDRSINFEKECEFAIQILGQNDYALKVAQGNRQSVVNAVTNIAAIGISLNPAKKQAYLVPRKGGISLAISYRGLVDLAVSCGSIAWAKTELVYEHDEFRLQGLDKAPIHNRNPFAKDRGEVIGAYCVAKLHNGDYMTEAMSIAEINDIRDRSEAWKAWKEKQRSCPWVTDPGEMQRKTVTIRASKAWPRVGGNSDRLEQAIHYTNTDGGEGLVDINQRAAAPADDKPVFDRTAWIEKANKAATLEDLAAVWRTGTDAAAKAKDREGYAAFKDVVTARKQLLEGKANATDAEPKKGGAA